MTHSAEEIFHEARGMPLSERAAYLEGACGGDTALRAKVEALLRADAEAGDFLRTSGDASPTADSAAAATMAAPLREGPGTRIGPYKLLQLIGEGGFGSVFMAEQEKPVTRKVALKIIKLGMDTRQVVARFEQERQALAMMDHPNIARVLDAGATETGRPFFVMELVKGNPIVEYCDKNNLSIEERLELFAQVCNAVQHAHTKGLIHRDIKPSNILVSTQDGRPHTKVIDFGIAKATASKLTEKTLFTEHRQLIGTPEYMSPEQAEGNLDIDTRTDVYSLGVLLYELLTGTTPFSSKELRSAAYAEIQRIIREVEPPRPSTRLSTNTDTIASVAAHRRTEPKRLGTLVRGEMDWIVMKALEKDRHRRYETANGLAMDIRRYLAGEAVMAAPPSATYRFKKLVKRNRGAVIVASLLVATLLAGVAGTSYGMAWALRERDIATKEASRAKVLNQFMEHMMRSGDPEDIGSRERTVVEMLERASGIADETLKSDPIAEGSARAFLAKTLNALGKLDEAEKQARRSVELRAVGPENGTLQHAESLQVLGQVLKAKSENAAALPLFQEEMSILRRLDPPQHKPIVQVHTDLAQVLEAMNRLPEASAQLDEAEALLDRSVPNGTELRASLLGVRARVMSAWKNDLEAVEALQTRVVQLRRDLPERHLLADDLNSLAVTKAKRGDLDGALAAYEEALGVLRSVYGDTHRLVAITLENISGVYYRRKEFDRSFKMLEEVLAIRIHTFGEDGFPVARTRFNMGVVAGDMGDPGRSLELIDGALPILRKNLGPTHPEVAQVMRNRVPPLKTLGRLDEALEVARAALAIYDTAVAPTDGRRQRALLDIVELLCAKGQVDEAQRIAADAIKALDPKVTDQAKWIKRLNDAVAACGAATPPLQTPALGDRPASGG